MPQTSTRAGADNCPPPNQKIQQRYTEATAESATLQELVVNELKSKKHVATEGLLWLTRCVSCHR
jgi:hypothetical protein